jgi:hypothetical protein
VTRPLLRLSLRGPAPVLAVTLALAAALGTASLAVPDAARAQPAPAGAAAPVNAGPAWSSLTAAQQQALATLRPTWATTNEASKLKWLEVADHFPRMSADERQRVQQRMAAWAAMSPNDRARARVQFQETRPIGAEQRQARWQAYQALPEDERKRLAQAAKKPAPQASASAASRTAAAAPAAKPDAANPKRNLVATMPSPAPRAVAPTVVQVKPGASTTTVANRAKPPLHHQHGLPKIVATPNFVDPNTLLPKRGPQAAAMRKVSSNDPTQQP